jgi:multiple sugar transport system permease protein
MQADGFGSPVSPWAGGGRLSPRQAVAAAVRRVGGYLMVAPAAVLICAFLFGPIAVSIWTSMTNEALTGVHAATWSFVGADNFKSLFSDPEFRHSIQVSVVYVLLSAVVGQTGVGLLVAYLSRNRANRFIVRFVGSAMIIAWVIPEVVVAFIWFAFAAQGGTLGKVLAPFGASHTEWLIRFPLVLVCIATTWGGAALSMLIFTAGLRSIPDEVIEAATVDGARTAQRIWQVELPILKRTIAVNLILVTLSTLTDFTLIYTLTGGGPGDATQTVPQYVYQQTLSFAQLGYGNAAAVMLLGFAALASLLYVRLLRVEV